VARVPAIVVSSGMNHQIVEVIMSCPSCTSCNQLEFPVEMIIHFAGLKNVDNPDVSLFPKFLVCLDCGFASVTVPETELAFLAVPRQVNDSRSPGVDSACYPG